MKRLQNQPRTKKKVPREVYEKKVLEPFHNLLFLILLLYTDFRLILDFRPPSSRAKIVVGIKKLFFALGYDFCSRGGGGVPKKSYLKNKDRSNPDFLLGTINIFHIKLFSC
jgi:hypothetical protein